MAQKKVITEQGIDRTKQGSCPNNCSSIARCRSGICTVGVFMADHSVFQDGYPFKDLQRRVAQPTVCPGVDALICQV